MTAHRDMRCLAERFIRRHAQDMHVLDADRLAAGLARKGRDRWSVAALRTIVIDVAGQRFVPTRWGKLPGSRTQ